MFSETLTSSPNPRQQELEFAIRDAPDLETAVELGKTLLEHAKENRYSSNSLALANGAHYIRNNMERHEVAKELFFFAAQFDDNNAASSINSLCFGWLIPEEDFDTADLLLAKAVNLNVGYESLNALSNLSLLRVRQGRYAEAELILAWIRLSNSELLRPEASFYLAHLVSKCGGSNESKVLHNEVSDSNDSDYAARSKDCLRGNCSVGQFNYQIVPPPFVNDSTIGLSDAFPRFTPDLPYDLTEDIDHNWDGSAFLKSLNSHAIDREFGSTIKFFISSMDFSDSVVRGIVSRHVGSCLESNQWPLGLYLLARFGTLDLTDSLALEAAKTLLTNVDTASSEVAAKIVGLTQAANLELLTRRHDLSTASEFVEQTLALESGEWFYSRALLSLASANLKSAQKHLESSVAYGFAPAKLLSLAVNLEYGGDREEAKKASLEIGHDHQNSFLSTSEALLAISSELRANLPIRERGDESSNSPRVLIAEELLALILVAAAVEDTRELKALILENFNQIPTVSIGNFTEGLIPFLNIVDSDLAAKDLSRWPRLLQVLDEIGRTNVLQVLAINPTLKDHQFFHESQPLVELFRGNSSSEELAKLARHEEEIVQLHVAQSENVSADTLLVLGTSRFKSVQEAAITSKRLSEEQLQQLLSGMSSDVQWALASEESTDASLLVALASSPAESVRRAVAGNKNTPVHLFDTLALDPSWPVRQQVVANPSAPDSSKALAALQS